MAEQGRRRLTTNTPSLNEPKGRSLRKVVSLSGQFHANYIIYSEEVEASRRPGAYAGDNARSKSEDNSSKVRNCFLKQAICE